MTDSNRKTVRFADEEIDARKDGQRRADPAFGGAPTAMRRDDPFSKSTALSQATLAEDMSRNFLKARSQPKKKGHEEREVTEIQLPSEKKIILASGHKRELARKDMDEAAGPFGRDTPTKFDAEVLEDLDRAVEHLNKASASKPINVDEENDS